MTFILSLANPDQVVQISDRRLVIDGKLHHVEENKSTLLSTLDARLLCGFTGLARAGSFRTAQWLLEALGDVSPPDDRAEGMVQRFTERASNDFAGLPALRGLAPADKRLSVIFTGYLYVAEPPLIVSALTTNFQDFDSKVDSREAWSEFKTWYFPERRPPVGEMVPTFVQRIGAWQAMTGEDERELRTLLRERKPSAALVGKGVELVQAMADRRGAGGAIGKELTSAILLPEPQAPLGTGFHVTEAMHKVPGINQVIAHGEGHRMLLMDMQIEAVEPDQAPHMVVPKVGRNQPCPCGSGVKYKLCHGRRI